MTTAIARPRPGAGGGAGGPPPVDRDGALWFNLVLPVTRVGVGPFSVDLFKQAIGCPVDEILAPLLRAPKFQRPSEAGTAVEVFPLQIPEGEGLAVPLGQFGEVGFKNRRGYLILTVPLKAREWIERRFAGAIVQGPKEGTSTDGTSRVAHYAIRLSPGMKAGFPLGVLGEVGVEAG